MSADEGKEEYEEVQAELRKKDEEVKNLHLVMYHNNIIILYKCGVVDAKFHV